MSGEGDDDNNGKPKSALVTPPGGPRPADSIHAVRPGEVLRRVTLPLVAPGVSAGALLCFTRALGEFGATITFAGNFTGTTQTAPLAVYVALDSDPEVALALGVVLLVVCVAVLGLLRGRWLR